MGTRGAIGFRFRGQDKVTYNHFDSYPTGIGEDVFKVARDFDDEQLAGAFQRIVLVNEDEPPTPELIERYAPLFYGGNVSRQTPEEWYSLLRNAQGHLDVFVKGDLDHMIDSHEFLTDGLFCEWAYIINLDERVVEVYRGFYKTPGRGRYGEIKNPPWTTADGRVITNDYYGVSNIANVAFDDVRQFTDEGLAKFMQDLESVVYAAEEAAV